MRRCCSPQWSWLDNIPVVGCLPFLLCNFPVSLLVSPRIISKVNYLHSTLLKVCLLRCPRCPARRTQDCPGPVGPGYEGALIKSKAGAPGVPEHSPAHLHITGTGDVAHVGACVPFSLCLQTCQEKAPVEVGTGAEAGSQPGGQEGSSRDFLSWPLDSHITHKQL